MIDLPLLGLLPAGGRTTGALAAAIAGGLKQKNLILDPSVAAEISHYRPFYILGEVNTPGQYPYRPRMTALTAVSHRRRLHLPGGAGLCRRHPRHRRRPPPSTAPRFPLWPPPAMSSRSLNAGSERSSGGLRLNLAVLAAGIASFVNMYCTMAVLPLLARSFHVSQAATGPHRHRARCWPPRSWRR